MLATQPLACEPLGWQGMCGSAGAGRREKSGRHWWLLRETEGSFGMQRIAGEAHAERSVAHVIRPMTCSDARLHIDRCLVDVIPFRVGVVVYVWFHCACVCLAPKPWL